MQLSKTNAYPKNCFLRDILSSDTVHNRLLSTYIPEQAPKNHVKQLKISNIQAEEDQIKQATLKDR